MKYLSIFLFIILVGCTVSGESPCAKKAREKKEAEEAKAQVITTPDIEEDVVIKPEEHIANTTKGDVYTHVSHKISERVCVLKKFSATITGARWSDKVEGLIVYQIEYIDSEGDFDNGEFYETEFTIGECSGF